MTLHRQIRSTGVYNIELGIAKLCLDDIQDIISAMESFAKEYSQRSEDGNDWSITLQAGRAIADSAEDLREATRDEIKQVSIALSEPYIRIDLWERSANIRTDNDGPETRAFAEDIAIFVASKSVWLPDTPHILRMVGSTWALASIVFVFAIVRTLQHHSGFSDYCTAAAVFILGGAWLVVDPVFHRIMGFDDGVRITPVRRSENRGLSKRARRDIAIAFGAALISAAAIGFAGLWAGVFAK